jgi:predicted amidohydrolase
VPSHELVNAQVDRVIEACTSTDIGIGVHTYSLDEAKAWISKGVRMLSYSSDIAMVVDVNTDKLRNLRAFHTGDAQRPLPTQ